VVAPGRRSAEETDVLIIIITLIIIKYGHQYYVGNLAIIIIINNPVYVKETYPSRFEVANNILGLE
jgi:hypothetical protein